MGTFIAFVKYLFNGTKHPDQLLEDILTPFTKVVSKLEAHAVAMVQEGDDKLNQAIQLNKEAAVHHLSASKAWAVVGKIKAIL